MFDDIVNTNDDEITDTFDYKKGYENVLKQIDKLADYIMAEFQDKIGKGGSLGAVDEAIRLLKEYKTMTKTLDVNA
jgi:hypothetical protein